MFGSRRSRETNPVYVEDVRFSKTSPIKFVGIRPRESKPRSKCVWLPKAKGNESYIYVCWCREAERKEPQYFLKKQGRWKLNLGESLCWLKWNPYICDCETNLILGVMELRTPVCLSAKKKLSRYWWKFVNAERWERSYASTFVKHVHKNKVFPCYNE